MIEAINGDFMNDNIQLSYKELKSYPQFRAAKETFKRIQKFGKRHRFDKKREYQIVDMMQDCDEDYEWWDNLSRDSAHKGHIHQDIGWLIAHGFPAFAKHYHHPIYIAFDYSDSDRNGCYRLTTYWKQ